MFSILFNGFMKFSPITIGHLMYKNGLGFDHFRYFSKFIDPQSDFGFTRLLKDKTITKQIISKILDKDIEEITHYPTNLTPLQNESLAYYDAFCKSKDGSSFIVKIKRYGIGGANTGVLRRMQFYNDDTILSQYRSPSDDYVSKVSGLENIRFKNRVSKYKDLKPVYSISFIAPNKKGEQKYKFFDDDDAISSFSLLNEKFLNEEIDRKDIKVKVMPNSLSKYVYVELNKLKLDAMEDTPLKQWLTLFKEGHSMTSIPKGKLAEGIERAYNILDKNTLTPEELQQLRFLEDSKAQFVADCIEEEKIKNIKKEISTYKELFELEMSPEKIHKAMSLNPAETEIFNKSLSEEEDIESIVKEILPLRMNDIDLAGDNSSTDTE